MAAGGLIVAAMAAAGLLAGEAGGVQDWRCTNAGLAEVRCTAGGCDSTGGFTPMEVRVVDEEVSLCAYSACFEGAAKALASGKSNLVVGSTLQRAGGADDPTLLMLAIDPESNSGTMLWNGFANPLRCTAG